MTRAVTSTKAAEREKVYYCNVCGYGYANEALAKECEEYCTIHTQQLLFANYIKGHP